MLSSLESASQSSFESASHPSLNSIESASQKSLDSASYPRLSFFESTSPESSEFESLELPENAPSKSS